MDEIEKALEEFWMTNGGEEYASTHAAVLAAIASALKSAREEALGAAAALVEERGCRCLDCRLQRPTRALQLAAEIRALSSPAPTPGAKCEACGGCGWANPQMANAPPKEGPLTAKWIMEAYRACPACHGTGQSPAKGAP